jgi:hypothetical protein
VFAPAPFDALLESEERSRIARLAPKRKSGPPNLCGEYLPLGTL